jgi:hypothetical protein
MAGPESHLEPLRFGNFEVDLRAGELRKAGVKLKLGGQPFQILTILLERPGEVVTREELQKRLWPDTFVDVDHNLNKAINKIREVLRVRGRARALSKHCLGGVIDSSRPFKAQPHPPLNRTKSYLPLHRETEEDPYITG